MDCYVMHGTKGRPTEMAEASAAMSHAQTVIFTGVRSLLNFVSMCLYTQH